MTETKEWLKKIIRSCVTHAQLQSSRVVIELYLDLLRKDAVEGLRTIEDELLSTWLDREAQIMI